MVSSNNHSGNNNSDHDYKGSIQMEAASDESSSLLQHRHPTHHSGDIETPLLDATSAAATTHSTGTTATTITSSLSSCWNSYVSIVERRPLLTKSITATIILGGADLCAQGLEHVRGVSSSSTGIDWPRAARFACFGLFGAPWSHYYFAALDHCIPPHNACCSPTTLIKVCIDQFIQAPILLAIMISMLSLMKGEGLEGVKKDMSDNFVNALIANWKLWLPASAVNMLFVKPSLRVLYVNVVFFLWTIILSLMLNQP